MHSSAAAPRRRHRADHVDARPRDEPARCAAQGAPFQRLLALRAAQWPRERGARRLIARTHVPGSFSDCSALHQLQTGKRLRFNGFRENDLPQIKEFVKTNYGTDVQQRDMAVRGLRASRTSTRAACPVRQPPTFGSPVHKRTPNAPPHPPTRPTPNPPFPPGLRPQLGLHDHERLQPRLLRRRQDRLRG